MTIGIDVTARGLLLTSGTASRIDLEPNEGDDDSQAKAHIAVLGDAEGQRRTGLPSVGVSSRKFILA